MQPELILINPWIYDFAAYDLWAKPLGLLYLAGHLRRYGFGIHLIDCLGLHYPGVKENQARDPVRRPFGTGKFWRVKASRPSPLKDIPRPYSRYGISTQLFKQSLRNVAQPSAILVTSMMTYWYPGAQEVVRLCGEVFPDVPVILGGTYARLCTEHAVRTSGAWDVVTGSGNEAIATLISILEKYGVKSEMERDGLGLRPYPAFDLFPELEYVCLLTSLGCPFRCAYCASNFLYPKLRRRDPHDVVEEILYWNKTRKVRDFAFYDDALLIESESHAAVFLEQIVRCNLNVRFHTPNGLHVREIRPEIAELLFRAGFHTIRLGLETADAGLHLRMGNKISDGDFERSVASLRSAGFEKREIGAYILMGLPGQSAESVRTTIEFADKAGAIPYLAEYSPIPHTALWEEAISHSAYDLASEPLFQNNTLLACWDEQSKELVPDLKELVRSIRLEGRGQ